MTGVRQPIRRYTLALATLVATVASLAACGLPQDARARPVASGDVPPGLLGSTTTVAFSPAGQGPLATLYFLNDDSSHLVPVRRRLADGGATAALQAVIAGPGVDTRPPLRSDIPPETQVVSLRQDGQELTVVLSGEILKVVGSAQANAFAQLVWTATELPGIRQVTFEVDDPTRGPDQVKPQTDRGSEQAQLSRSDYQQIGPLPIITVPASGTASATGSG